jgi:NAD(P)-dependent dehydrogenase (short-subunit alcohol dehydrogenase family)
LLDRNPVTETVKELKKSYQDVAIKEIKLDVASEDAVNDSVTQTVKEFGRIDYAFNNAGIGGALKTTNEIPLDDFQRVIDVNLKGVWLCQRAQIRQMLQQEKLSDSPRSYRGSIVNTASMYGLISPSINVPSTAYATSKHAVIGLTKADATVFAPQGIKINALCPGYIATPLVMSTMDKGSVMENERVKVPLQRLGTMEEMGDLVAFLHSEASSYMIGASLTADGGFTIQ